MYQLYQPSARLSAFVDCFWESNFSAFGNDTYRELFVAQLNPNIIINLSNHYHRNNVIVKQSTLDAINTEAIVFSHRSNNQLFGIRLKPAGLGMFTPLGMHELLDASIQLKDVFGDDTEHFEDELLKKTTSQQRIALTESFLLKKLDERNLRKCLFHAAVQDNITKHYQDPNCIALVVSQMNTSHRTFDRNFTQFLGLTPKKIHRLIRFQKVYEALLTSKTDVLSFDFYTFGYYDQAHFSKEFREFTGMAFKEYLNSLFFVQNLQDNHFHDR
jgi:AraC-like DNA-binding protein